VSAILKALKKLEQETSENTGVSLTMGIGDHPDRRPGALVIPGLIVFTMCIFTGIGVYIYTQKTSLPDPPGAMLSSETIVPEKETPAEKELPQNANPLIASQKTAKPSIAAPEVAFSPNSRSSKDRQPTEPVQEVKELPDIIQQKMPPGSSGALPESENISDPIKSEAPVLPVTPVPVRMPENNVPFMETSALFASSRQPDNKTKASIPLLPAANEKTAAPEPIAKETGSPYAVIEDPSVELQAISWSADAEKRLAIINGKICREKDTVAGYVIQSINSGDVVMSKGSVKGKLIFEIR
jgi:hypothetical protein